MKAAPAEAIRVRGVMARSFGFGGEDFRVADARPVRKGPFGQTVVRSGLEPRRVDRGLAVERATDCVAVLEPIPEDELAVAHLRTQGEGELTDLTT